MKRSTHDIIIVGGGHAGCEAALAAARMGARSLLITVSRESIGRMSCNPAIGGLAKGQLVREVDALGGEMAKVTDETGIQFKMLNVKKGPAVHSPRAQVDRFLYERTMRARLEDCAGLEIAEDVAAEIVTGDGSAAGVIGGSGTRYAAPRLILTTGTVLRGVIHVGTDQSGGGRYGEPAADALSDSLEKLGLELGRLKTGTPPRVDRDSIDFGACEVQSGDDTPLPFSFSTERIDRPRVPCHLTKTTTRTHEILRDNLGRAPLYSGQIQSVGPRYCPSIETKIVRFADKDSHLIFLEPEGIESNSIYCNGISTSMPRDVQDAMAASIPGLENARILRYGYAIEYDFVPPTQTGPTLESKVVPGLFLAGQINGTSGYEEAAGQGIVAGINAVRSLRGEEPLILTRAEAYIGVLIDDLVTEGTAEPYRMFTSRAEYRLMLRQDNADRRLMKHGHECGLISGEQYDRLRRKEDAIAATREYLETRRIDGAPLMQLLRRSENDFAALEALDPELAAQSLPDDVKEQAEIEAKYEGYIQRQLRDIERFRSLEDKRIPERIDYAGITGLTFEAAEKLSAVRPVSIGQASRISGVSPADVSVLLVHLRSR
ncbi:MAG: tRNA uridine-5-carboxymethylaminomethyl(34) synthesis enzyme MnmG [Planctomycetota bacterium]